MKTDIRNHITTARGTHTIINENNMVTYGFTDVQFWIPSKQSWIPASQDPDKFLIVAEDFETASSEFWARWKIYMSKRFPSLTYINLEPTN